MCVIYTVRAYIVCENDFSFEGGCRSKRIWVDGDQIKGGWPFLSDRDMWDFQEETREDEEESGCLPLQDVSVVSSLINMQQSFFFYYYEFSLLWPLINNVALVLLLFRKLVLSCCNVKVA